MDEIDSTALLQKNKRLFRVLLFVVVGGLLLCIFISFLFTAPKGPYPRSVSIQEGSSAAAIAHELKVAHIVRSELLLYVLLTYSNDPRKIYAGTYVFDTPLSTYAVAQKLAGGDIQVPTITLTIPEGIRINEIARIAERSLKKFNTEEFLKLSEDREGYLLPETYRVPPTFTARELFDLLTSTFEKNTSHFFVSSSTLQEKEIVVLASILEREANDETSMRMVSGVLQNRLAIGMPLQADATMEYVLDKPLKELTPKDLTIDSPYNTYLNKGLPPTPIGNPGVLALDAAIHPKEHEYLFYITGNDGTFYFARTYPEHIQNISKYLR